MERLSRVSRHTPLPACRVIGFSIPSRHHRHAQVTSALQRPDSSSSSSSRSVAAGAAAPAASGPAEAGSTSSSASPTFDLACPICQSTHFKVQQVAGSPAGDLRCPRCVRSFDANATFADLTLTSGVQQRAYRAQMWGGTTTFQSPLVSFAYERGWRQGFIWAGFPGADKEYELAMDYLQPGYGDVLVDMSCGSGLFTRRFLKSNRFQGVIAADFSESMLGQAKQYLQEDSSIDPASYMLLRADVGRLPFATASVAAIHAGAAIHCWPNPQAAMAEISRVLRPGGVFVASTFMTFTSPLGQLVGDDLVAPLSQLEPNPRMYKWWSEPELRDLCAAVGLVDFRRARSNRFIMFAAAKPLLE